MFIGLAYRPGNRPLAFQLLQNISLLSFVEATSTEPSVHSDCFHRAIRLPRPWRNVRPHPLCLVATAILHCAPSHAAPRPNHTSSVAAMAFIVPPPPRCHQEEVTAGAPALGCTLGCCSRRPPGPSSLATAVPQQVGHGCRRRHVLSVYVLDRCFKCFICML